MRNTKRTVFPAASAAVLAAALSACYSSAGPGRDASDVSPDRPPDAVHDTTPDTAPDTAPDLVPDPIVDVAQDETAPPPDIVDVVPDVPPFEGLTFVITNTADYPMYLSVWQYGEDPTDLEYDLYLDSDSLEPPGSVYIWQPWCTLDCASVPDPVNCCMDCIPPFVNTVKRLLPGESIRVRWDGTVFAMDYEVCECGCYRHFPAPYVEYTASVCGSPEYVCFTGVECYPDENGLIYGAGLSDMMACAERTFPVPEASGMEIDLIF